MLAFLILVVIFNCFSAKEYRDRDRDYQKNRYKYVSIESGKIRGRLARDGDYLAFLGIPYAEPPIGDNRFKSPEPPKPWEGVYDAVLEVKCPQNGEGEEDCLIINVFTPVETVNYLRPVLVYIHGGSFIMGSGPTKGMDPLIKQNIIVVTFNYRLGVLGFLCLGIRSAPGNAGLKDQIAALKWIKSNIAFFGGNPNQVTVYGMSAGGASVEHLVLSKITKGLFTKAIVESGSATSVWAVDPTPIKTARSLGEILEFPKTRFTEIMVEYYKNMHVDILTEANYDFYNNLTDGSFGFVPCVERKMRRVERVIAEPPLKTLETGRFERIPIMFLYSSLEGLYLRSVEYYENNYKEQMEKNFLDFLPADLIFDKEWFRDETAKNVRRFYFGNGTIGVMEYLQYFGDNLILHALLNSVELHASRCNTNVYLMEFAYRGGLGGHEKHYESMRQAGHGDVVKYAILNHPPDDESDKMTVRRVSCLIANFVKHGNPTPAITPLLPVEWPHVRPGNISYLYLDQEFKIGTNPYEKRIAFWDNLYAKFRRTIKPVHPH